MAWSLPEFNAWSSDMIFDTFLWYNCLQRKLYKPFHIIQLFFLKLLPVDIVTSKIQLSGMLLNFWRGWRAGWKRYCSRVFHQHSDQYHQILNMGRNHSLWRAVEEEWTKAGKHKIYYLGCWQKKKKNISKMARGMRHFNQIHTNTIPFHSMQQGCIVLCRV